MLPDPLVDMQAEMAPGERLLWADRGAARSRVLRSAPTALFGLFFFGFALIWTGMATAIGSAVDGEAIGGSAFGFFPLFGIPFLLVGAGLLLSPVWTWLKFRHALYGLSDRRALVVLSFPSRSVSSIPLDEIETPTRRDWRDGVRADLILKRERTIGSKGRVNTTEHGFFGIADARRVEAEVARLRREAPGEPDRAAG